MAPPGRTRRRASRHPWPQVLACIDSPSALPPTLSRGQFRHTGQTGLESWQATVAPPVLQVGTVGRRGGSGAQDSPQAPLQAALDAAEGFLHVLLGKRAGLGAQDDPD